MQDRVPLYPGRVTLTPVSGQANTFDLVRADQPTQEGTPLNKASLLKDTTAALFGLPNTAVPDDVLSEIKTLIDSANANANTKARIATGSYTGTGTYGSSNQNTLTFGFEPKLVFMFKDKLPLYKNINSQMVGPVYGTTIGMTTTYSQSLFNIYSRDNYFYAKKSSDGKKLSWYHEASAKAQMNVSGVKYQYIAIG